MHYIRILEHTHKNNFWAIVVLLCADPARRDLAPLEIEVIIVIIILPLSDRCAYFFKVCNKIALLTELEEP